MTLEIKDVATGYGDGADVVRGVSLTAEAGTVTTLIGPNGCGKSTLLGTVARLLEPRQGAVTLDDVDLHTLAPREAARRVALLPQHPSAPTGLTVGELVARGRHPYRGRFRGESAEDRAAVARAMERTETTELALRRLETLSGGQRQRVWLAMALAQDTPVMLLDEPTTFLDPAHAVSMLQLVRELARDGKTVIMVLHDLTLAGMYSDRLVVMRDGVVLAAGASSQAVTPEVLAEAYGLRAEVWDDPRSQAPIVVPRGVV